MAETGSTAAANVGVADSERVGGATTSSSGSGSGNLGDTVDGARRRARSDAAGIPTNGGIGNGGSVRDRKRLRYAAKQERKKMQQAAGEPQQQHGTGATARKKELGTHPRRTSPFPHAIDVTVADVECVRQLVREAAPSPLAAAAFQSDAADAAAAAVDAVARVRDSPLWQLRLLHPYLDLRERDDRGTRSAYGTDSDDDGNGNDDDNQSLTERLFIAEGIETVRLLLQQQQRQHQSSPFSTSSSTSTRSSVAGEQSIRIKSVFLKPSLLLHEQDGDGDGDRPAVSLHADLKRALAAAAAWPTGATTVTPPPAAGNVPPPLFHILRASSAHALSAAAGFAISRGCLACGVVPAGRTEAWLCRTYLPQLLRRQQQQQQLQLLPPHHGPAAATLTATPPTVHHVRLLALDGVSDTANLGAVVRTASAMGVHAILLSRDCCDAWYRRAVRVSVGHVFRVPVVRVHSLPDTLSHFAAAFDVVAYAAVVVDVDPVAHPNATCRLHELRQGTVSSSPPSIPYP